MSEWMNVYNLLQEWISLWMYETNEWLNEWIIKEWMSVWID